MRSTYTKRLSLQSPYWSPLIQWRLQRSPRVKQARTLQGSYWFRSSYRTSWALFGSYQAPPLSVPQDSGANYYSQQDLDRIIQTFLYISKKGSGDKVKAKTPDVYHGRFHMERYNFCQQCEDHFATCKATCGAIGLNQIPFAAFFWNQTNFCWQQHKWKLEAESSVPISWDEFKLFL